MSYEPAIGPVNFAACLGRIWGAERNRIDQIIVGGESSQGKHRARPFDIEWARSTVRQCRAAGVAPFVKQLGSLVHTSGCGPVWQPRFEDTGKGYFLAHLKDRAGADPAEWPEDLRVQEWPA